MRWRTFVALSVLAAAACSADVSGVWTRVGHDEDVFGGTGDQLIFSVVAGAGRFVAVGWSGKGDDFDGAVWLSDDGLGWRRVADRDVDAGGEGIQSIRGVVRTEDGFLAVGGDGSGEDQRAAVWMSQDGEGWQRVAEDAPALDGAGNQRMNAVAVGAQGPAAVGVEEIEGSSLPAFWTSDDASRWARVGGADGVRSGQATAIAGGRDGGWVAVGWVGDGNDRRAVSWTGTGDVWRRHEIDGDPSGARALLATGAGFVAVGRVDTRSGPRAAVWRSSDGRDWERIAVLDGSIGQSTEAFAVAGDGDGLTVAGQDGSAASVWRTTEEGNWELVVTLDPGASDEDIVFLRGFAMSIDRLVLGGGTTVIGGEGGVNDRAAVWTLERS